jgi:cytochrome c-type biogenesis protein CcmH
MGWLALLLLLALSLGALWLLGVRRGLLKATAAALLVGASGYALQGQPDLPGSPGQGSNEREVVPLTQARHAFFGNFSPEESWLLMSEALARDGKTEDAVGILRNAVGRYPGDEQLWIGLGNALVDHAHGLTPPAEFAYQRAAEVAPGRPAAPFFYGLALARSGDRAAAVELWTRILANAPANASWRPLIEQGVAALSSPRLRGEGDHPKGGGGAPPSDLRSATSPANAAEGI